MRFDQRIAIIGLVIPIAGLLGGLGGWLLSDAWKRGAESAQMDSLKQQNARIPDLENQRQKEKDRADRLDLEVASLRQRIDDMTTTYSAESARLHEALLSTQKELGAANLKASAQQKCAYLDELTKNSKKRLDNLTSVVAISSSDAFAQQESGQRQQLLSDFEKNRTALLECLKG